MRHHLFNRVTACPGILSDIELTEDIKKNILKNRLYHPPPVVPVPTITQTINNIHTMNNFVASLDPFVKIRHVTEHDNVELVDFETSVENRYKRNVRKFLTDGFRGDVLFTKNHFMNMVSDITESTDTANMNIVYDSSTDRVHFAVGGDDSGFRRHPHPAITFLIKTLAIYHLSYYEIYLIRKLVSGDRTGELDECLRLYYHFIGCFEIYPYVFGKNDSMILFNKNDERYVEQVERSDIEAHRIVDKYNSMYLRIKGELTDGDRRVAMKDVMDILKSNHKINITELNKRIMDILRVDNEFKARLMTGVSSEN